MSIARYIREIGRGREGARSLDLAGAHDLMSQVLDRRVTDLEIGAFALAMRIKGESVAELVGFLGAAQERCIADPQRPADDRPAVVQRLAPDPQSHRPPGDAPGRARRPGAGARQPARPEARHHRGDLPRPRPHLRHERARDRGRLEPARAGVHRHCRALPAAGPADRGAPGGRACATRGTRSPSCSPAAAAGGRCASSTTPIPNTAPGWPSSSPRPGPTCC